MLRTGSIFTIQTSKLGYSRVLDGWSRCWPTEFLKWNSFSKIWNFLVIKEAQTKFNLCLAFQHVFETERGFWEGKFTSRRREIRSLSSSCSLPWLFSAPAAYGSFEPFSSPRTSLDIGRSWKILSSRVTYPAPIVTYCDTADTVFTSYQVLGFQGLCSEPVHCRPWRGIVTSTPPKQAHQDKHRDVLLLVLQSCLKYVWKWHDVPWCSMMFHVVPCSSMSDMSRRWSCQAGRVLADLERHMTAPKRRHENQREKNMGKHGKRRKTVINESMAFNQF